MSPETDDGDFVCCWVTTSHHHRHHHHHQRWCCCWVASQRLFDSANTGRHQQKTFFVTKEQHIRRKKDYLQEGEFRLLCLFAVITHSKELVKKSPQNYCSIRTAARGHLRYSGFCSCYLLLPTTTTSDRYQAFGGETNYNWLQSLPDRARWWQGN